MVSITLEQISLGLWYAISIFSFKYIFNCYLGKVILLLCFDLQLQDSYFFNLDFLFLSCMFSFLPNTFIFLQAFILFKKVAPLQLLCLLRYQCLFTFAFFLVHHYFLNNNNNLCFSFFLSTDTSFQIFLIFILCHFFHVLYHF